MGPHSNEAVESPESSQKLLEAVHERGCYVFGTGFVASMFVEALRIHGELERVKGYLTTECHEPREFEGAPVRAAADRAVDRSALVCVAVHEASAAEVAQSLEQLGFSQITWIYPRLYDLVYGEPLYRQVVLETSHVIGAQDPSFNWLAVRALAAESLRGSACDQRDNALEAYVKAMALHCGAETARNRLNKLAALVRSMEEEGFHADAPVLVDTDLRIVDGLHRVAVAWLLGIERFPCDIVKASPAFDKLLTDRNKLTDDALAQAGLTDGQRGLVREMAQRMDCGGLRSDNCFTDEAYEYGAVSQHLNDIANQRIAQMIEEAVI